MRGKLTEKRERQRVRHFAVLQHRIFAVSSELVSTVSMLFRLIKESEI